jgi:hypothetical protein
LTLLSSALRGATHRPPAASPVPRGPAAALLVVGGGGTLGAALLAEALSSGGYAHVQALVAEPLASALRGFEPLALAALHAEPPPQLAHNAVIVFERSLAGNRRDEAFVQPQVDELAGLAVALHRGGVRRLVVVLPHAPALLPDALRHGLATLDEGAVARLGFEQLVFVRTPQPGGTLAGGSLLQRLARTWLAQLRLMVPQHEQPLRAVVLARCVVQLLRLLPAAAAGTRVLAPELLWQATRQGGGRRGRRGAAAGADRDAGARASPGAPAETADAPSDAVEAALRQWLGAPAPEGASR